MQFLIRSENLSAKKIIVTGGSGNLGRWAVRALSEAGHDVLSLDRAEPPERLCETRVADLSDIEALQDGDQTMLAGATQHADGLVSVTGQLQQVQGGGAA